jgi:hypothetical protein
MSIDPRNDRIVHYENIMRAFVDVCGFCNIRGAAEKIVAMEEKTEQPVDRPHVVIRTTDLHACVDRKRGEVTVQFAFYEPDREPERESVTLAELQEVVRDRVHWHGLNGLRVARDLLERFDIRRRGRDE